MRTKPNRKVTSNWIFCICFLIFILLISMTGYAADSESSSSSSSSSAPSSSTSKTTAPAASTSGAGVSVMASGGTTGAGGGSRTITPDLFTGNMGTSVSIEVAPGRKGMQPDLALTYRSDGGNGWVGVGWELELGAIERSTKNGVTYTSADTFVLSFGGSGMDLVEIGSYVDYKEYRAKIEGGFLRIIQKNPSTSGASWVVTDKSGVQYFYGRDASTRQDNAAGIFKWCLDYVLDTNGNFMQMSYSKDLGQIYPDRIDYTGNVDKTPTKYVKFNRESRTDVAVMYTTNFAVTTASRLKSIDVYASDVSGTSRLVRTYVLSYAAAYSASTRRSLLTSVQQFGKDGTTPLPATTFTWQDSAGESGTFPSTFDWSATGGAGAGFIAMLGDFDGDGKADIYIFNYNTGEHIVWLNKGGGTFSESWRKTISSHIGYVPQPGDFNADGKSDIYLFKSSTGDHIVLLNKGAGTFSDTESAYKWQKSGGAGYTVQVGDFDGDGYPDIYMYTAAGANILWLNKNMTFPSSSTWSWSAYANATKVLLGDFDGDGKTDIYLFYTSGTHYVFLNNGSGGFPSTPSWASGSTPYGAGYTVQLGDFNGDGRPDIYMVKSDTGRHIVWLNQGRGTFDKTTTNPYTWNPAGSYGTGYAAQLGDFNGDGKADIYMFNSTSGDHIVWLNKGDGTFPTEADSNPFYKWQKSEGAGAIAELGDLNGDGKLDIYLFNFNSGAHNVLLNEGQYPDLLSSVSNGMGGLTTVTYAPSTQYANTQLNFPVQTVSSVTSCDNYQGTCRGTESTSSYTYGGGFYHIGDREFRGFNYVKVTGPLGPHNEQVMTETWFHQGNDRDLTNNPYVSNGFMKGRPYWTRVSDATNLNGGKAPVYTESTTTYAAQVTTTSPPYFNPPYQVDIFNCDGAAYGQCDAAASAQHIQTVYTYDETYGNLTYEYQYGDTADSSDDRTIARDYTNSLNTTAWIVGLPSSETIYDTSGKVVSQTVYYYDGVTDCSADNTTQNPTKGNVTRVRRMLDGTNDPSVRMGYDVYGNLTCSRDANGNVSTIYYGDSSYNFDGTATFPTKTLTPKVGTNTQGYPTTTEYYDGSSDLGLYGQVKSVTGPNGADTKTEYQYDKLGRKTKIITDLGRNWTSWSYPIVAGSGNVFGAVGSQYVETDTAVNISSWTYFDGFGRSIIEKQTASDGKIIVTNSTYNNTGTTAQVSVPYFDGEATPGVTKFTYDSMGRTTHLENPDGATMDSCYYNNGVTVTIDADKHRRRETRNVQGALVKVEEYTGTHTSCTKNAANEAIDLYATTKYTYDVLGNLLTVTDAKNNLTTLTYDMLGRKISMTDPDMGQWTYAYDANGNLIKQTDAKGQIITFTYDVLNRITKKHYPRVTYGPDVVYTYDTAPSSYPTYTTYPIGRLTSMTDGSGTTTFFYDHMGRTTKTIRKVGGTDYPIDFVYTVGRLTSIKYPDQEVVEYKYDSGGHLIQVVDSATQKPYATYSDFNAYSQARSVAYANQIKTTFQYSPFNKRLIGITAVNPALPTAPPLLNVTYSYSNAGNITAIADNLDSTKSQSFSYDEINRLIVAQSINYGTQQYAYNTIGNIVYKEGVTYTYDPASKPHAVKSTTDGKTYTYDSNGNMITNGAQSINYDFDNMPRSVILNSVTTSFVYDGSGARVKKTTPSATTLYIGKMYECRGTTCSKYIFAGGTRIAIKTTAGVFYYHQDHLNSSNIVTDSAGNKVEEIRYMPFGATLSDTGSYSVNHKYTSQEFDAETGLYYYNARYYSPTLGRFISPDLLIADYADPQSLNRYSYVKNNPIIYNDPTGHRHWRKLIRHVVKAVVCPAIVEFEYNSRLVKKYPGLAMVEGAAASYFGGPLGSAAFSGYMSYVNGGHFNDILKSASISYVSGAIGRGVSYDLSTYGLNPGFSGTIGAMAGSGTHAALTGGNVLQSALAGGFSSAFSAAIGNTNDFIRIGSSSLVSGVTTSMTGGKFGQGAMNGALSGITMLAAERYSAELGAYGSARESRDQNKHAVEEIMSSGMSDVEKWNAIKAVYGSLTFGADVEGLRSFDLKADMVKFDDLHVRWNGMDLGDSHYDKYDIVTDPVKHVIIDTIGGLPHGL